MRHVRSLRLLALSFGLALAACGGSSVNGGPDSAGGADGGNDAAVDGGHAGGGSGGGTAGASGKDGGAAGKDAGSDVADAAGDVSADVASDAAADASADGANDVAPTDLCAAIAIDAPAATVTNLDNGKTVDPTAFSGGVVPSGTYWLTSVTHFGGTYAGPTQEIWVVDATAKTLVVATVVSAPPSDAYAAFSLTSKTTSALKGAPVCGATAASQWNYTVASSAAGTKLSVNLDGSSDVKIYTKQ